MSYLFPDFSLAFFREISEQASRQLVTKEQRKFCKHAKRRNWRYYNMSKNETPQRENEMNTPTSEGFTLSQIASLRTEIKKKYSWHPCYSFVFKNKAEKNRNDEKYS